MAYKESYTSQRYREPLQNRLSESQLDALEKDVARFTKELKIQWPPKSGKIEIVRVFDEIAWMASKNAMTPQGSIKMKGYRPGKSAGGRIIESTDCEPILYEQLRADLEQLGDRKSKKSYGKKMEDIELDKIASSMKID